jgi:hypothetical protein
MQDFLDAITAAGRDAERLAARRPRSDQTGGIPHWQITKFAHNSVASTENT